MDILMYLGIFVVSLAALLKSSDWFVDAAETIGLSLGVAPFIIGVTVVAFGTSLPELATSIASVYSGQSEVVVGNVVGSNITNIALVLGLTALAVKRIPIEKNLWTLDMTFLWAASFMLWFVIRDGSLSTYECVLLLTGIVLYLAYSFGSDDQEKTAVEDRPKAGLKTVALLLLGAAGVWLGAKYTIFGIEHISSIMGIPTKIIALSAVAIGTSLPEVVVSITAARRGKAAIAVGNVLGSNIFNIFVVMGLPGLLGPLVIPEEILTFYLPLMLVMTLLFGVMVFDDEITQWEGLLLLLFFMVFMGEIFAAAA